MNAHYCVIDKPERTWNYSLSYAQHCGHHNESYDVLCHYKIIHFKIQIRGENILEIHVMFSFKISFYNIL